MYNYMRFDVSRFDLVEDEFLFSEAAMVGCSLEVENSPMAKYLEHELGSFFVTTGFVCKCP